MTNLRIYNVGKGDCMAIRHNHSTKFIYDTGEGGKHFKRGKTRSQCEGFGLALFDAVGRVDTPTTRPPPTVIISHVDLDHIGGLRDWIISVLKEANSWDEAREIARRELREVWCNIPLNNQALADSANISLFSTRERDPNQTFGDPEELIKQWQDHFSPGEHEMGPKEDINRIQDIEEYSKKVFGTYPRHEEGNESFSDDLFRFNPPHSEWLKQTLKDVYPEQGSFIDDVFRWRGYLPDLPIIFTSIDNEQKADKEGSAAIYVTLELNFFIRPNNKNRPLLEFRLRSHPAIGTHSNQNGLAFDFLAVSFFTNAPGEDSYFRIKENDISILLCC